MTFNIPVSGVVSSCLGLLDLMNIKAWRNNTGALKDQHGRLVRYGLKGSADIIGILPDDRFLSVECKREGGKVRPEQKQFQDMINSNNGVAVIVHSCDELLQELKKKGMEIGVNYDTSLIFFYKRKEMPDSLGHLHIWLIKSPKSVSD